MCACLSLHDFVSTSSRVVHFGVCLTFVQPPLPHVVDSCNSFQAPSTLALSTRHNLWEEMLQAMGGEYAEMSRLPPVGRWKELGVENHPCDFPL